MTTIVSHHTWLFIGRHATPTNRTPNAAKRTRTRCVFRWSADLVLRLEELDDVAAAELGGQRAVALGVGRLDLDAAGAEHGRRAVLGEERDPPAVALEARVDLLPARDQRLLRRGGARAARALREGRGEAGWLLVGYASQTREETNVNTNTNRLFVSTCEADAECASALRIGSAGKLGSETCRNSVGRCDGTRLHVAPDVIVSPSRSRSRAESSGRYSFAVEVGGRHYMR